MTTDQTAGRATLERYAAQPGAFLLQFAKPSIGQRWVS